MRSVGFDDTSSVCCGPRPIILDEIILSLLRDRFVDSSEIIPEQISHYKWQAGDPPCDTSATTSSRHIMIERSTTWLAKYPDITPAITVRRNKISPHRISVGDKFHGASTDSRIKLISGSHAIFTMSRVEAEANELAGYVWETILEQEPLIRSSLGFSEFSVGDLDAAGIVEEAQTTQVFAVPFTIQYAYQKAWSIQAIKPPLKTISLTTEET